MSDTTTSASAAEPTHAGPISVTGATTYRGRRIQQLQQEINELETAVHTVLTTGKSYTLSNSHAVTRADVSDIESQLAAKKQELACLLYNRPFNPMRHMPTKFF